MGVPKFYRWMSERYPLINQMLSSTAVLPEFDNFYLDMNGIIHACTHPNSDFLANSLSLREMMLSIFRYVDRMVTEIVRPKKVLFMAIDGVAPRAKLNQQRARRFCAAEGRTDSINQAKAKGEVVDEDNLFDSNCITPGTEFMDTVSRHLKWFIRKKVKEDPLWRNLTIVFSGHDVPGEGEHKIMQFIRDLRADPNYEPNIRHCMYGQDADLIMLGLATHEPHFALLREVIHFNVGGPKKPAREVVMRQTRDAQFQLLHLSILREYLTLDFAYGMEAHADQERIIDDFIFLTFLVGNDFLPHLPTLDISEHAFDVLINAYRQLFAQKPGYIVHQGEIGDYERLEALFQIIGSKEMDILANREVEVKEFNSRRRKHQADLPTEEEQEEAEEAAQLAFEAALQEALGGDAVANAKEEEVVPEEHEVAEEEGDEEEKSESVPKKDYRGRYYYEKFRVIASAPDGSAYLTELMRHYLKGLMWCLAYYVKGCISWTWYYPYHYGPMLKDMINLEQLQSEISFELGQPFSPYQQLLGCLPPASANLLPSCYKWLMTNDESPVIHFYPLEFKVDLDGKKNPWEAVVLLDFIGEDKLLSAESHYCPTVKLTRSEINRNKFGHILIYTFDPSANDTYLSCNPEIGLPDIHNCQSRVLETSFDLSPGHFFKAELVEGTIYPIAGYPSLTTLQLEQVVIEPIKVNVFGSASKYKSLVIEIHRPKIENFNTSVAEMLLGRTVFVNYPQVHEAKVVAVTTETDEVRIEGDVEDDQTKWRVMKISNDHITANKWKTDAAAEEQKYLCGRNTPGSGGLVIGDVAIRLRVRPLQGLKRDPVTGATKKVYSKSLEADIPIQLALWTPPVLDTRFEETSDMPIEKLMPLGSTIVAVTGQLIGCSGVVVGPHKSNTVSKQKLADGKGKKRTVDVEFKIPQPEPPFGYSIAHSIADQYFGAKDICNLLNIQPNVLGKIVGSIRVEPGRGDLGLNLKRNGMYQLLGYVRRVENEKTSQQRQVWQGLDTVQIIGTVNENGEDKATLAEVTYWEYSTHAVVLLCEYKARFPLLFSQLERLPHQPVYQGNDLFGKEATKYIAAIMEWMKAQAFFSLPRTPFTTSSLSREAMVAIERASDVHSTLNATKGYKLITVKGIPIDKVYCNVTRTTNDVALPYNSLEPRLGDRIANLACPGVPLGLRGTVVTIHQATKYVEVSRKFLSPFSFILIINPCVSTGDL